MIVTHRPGMAGVVYFHTMKRSFRFALYIMIGFIIYQVIDSGESAFTHEEVKKTLIIGMIVVFVLLVVVRIIKQRYEDQDPKD